MHKSDWLLSFGQSIKAQHGEDGIVDKIFEIIGSKSRFCVELGALAGGQGNNTWHLIKDLKWNAVLIEADPTYFIELQKEYKDHKNVTCVNAFISFEGPNSLDSVFARTPLPKSFDLLSLDIDGNDYHVWKSLTEYRPRVMVVEFNPSIPNDVEFIQARDMSVFQGSSLRALVALGKEKGYELVAANETNAFFVEAELFPLFDMDNTVLDQVHTDKRYLTYLFQLYDGSIKIAGNKKLIWHGKEIDESKLQVLSARKRFFPNRINSNDTVRYIKQVARKMPFYRIVQRVRKSL
jgi:hypothetical protein